MALLRHVSLIVPIFVWSVFAPTAGAQLVGSFVWNDTSGQSDPDKQLRVYYRAPSTIGPDTPVWFVMHGANRNADDYRDYLGNAPAAADALVIAPEFSSADWSGSRRYNLGNVSVSESNLTPRPRDEWSFSKIEPLFDYVRTTIAPQVTAERYSMYGHSAGAQFIHRYLMWEPDARVNVAVAANAGWYTLPTRPEAADEYPHAWPYSLTDAPDYDATTTTVDALPSSNVVNAFDQRLVVLLGENDTRRTSSLRQTPEADDQGPHRFARGQFYYASAEAEAARLGVSFNWGLRFVPGVDHSGQEMAIPAAEILHLAEVRAGDFNADGSIDAEDYGSWRSAFGTEPLVPGLGADGNGDGVVNAADYTVWRDALEPTLQAAIPEPSGTALAMASVLVAALARRMRIACVGFASACFLTIAPSIGLAEATVFFGGDTHFGENYQELYEAEGRPNITKSRDYSQGFAGLAPLIRDADIRILNLETTLTVLRESPVKGKISYLYSDPQRAPAALSRLNVHAVSLANNHAMDFGRAGLTETLDALRRAGIASYGAGLDQASAEAPYVVDLPVGDSSADIDTMTLVVIGAFEQRKAYEPFNFYAKGQHPGVNPIDTERLRSQIARFREEDRDCLIVVTPHWGQNYVWRTDELRRLAEGFAQAGADLVVGHGAHCLQEIELLGDTLVFYSIGNLVFQKWVPYVSRSAPPYSLALRVTAKRDTHGEIILDLRAYPIVSDNTLTDYQPRVVTMNEAAAVQELLAKRDTSGVVGRRGSWNEDAHGPHLAISHRVARRRSATARSEEGSP